MAGGGGGGGGGGYVCVYECMCVLGRVEVEVSIAHQFSLTMSAEDGGQSAVHQLLQETIAERELALVGGQGGRERKKETGMGGGGTEEQMLTSGH